MSNVSADVSERASRIRLAVFDVDGVLTDGRLHFSDDGREIKSFHAHDGLGLKLLEAAGIAVGIISSRNSPVVNQRMTSLGIEHVYTGRHDKQATLIELLTALDIGAEETAYTGDDWVDLGVMSQVGLAIAVANADEEVVKRAHWTTHARGGDGAAREVCRLLLSAQGRLDEQLALALNN